MLIYLIFDYIQRTNVYNFIDSSQENPVALAAG